VSFISLLRSTLAIFFLFSIHSALAANVPDNLNGSKPENVPWLNQGPDFGDYDWIQLVSGEWLKGEIKGLYNENLEFESDILDLLTIDWEDVSYLRAHLSSNVNIEGYGTITGYVEITPDQIIIRNVNGIRQFDRLLLVSLVTGGEKELDFWSAKLTLGVNFRSGNTDQVDYNAKFNIERETTFSRFVADYIGNISLTSNVETSNSHRLTTSHDIFQTRRFFFRPFFGEFFRDPFQNIESKVTLGAGLGYKIIDTSKSEWLIGGGPGYQNTRYKSVLPGEDNSEDTPALILGTAYDVELTSWLDYLFNYNIIWVNQASGGYTHHLVSTIESELIGSFDLDISFVWDHINNPIITDNGLRPEKNDFRFIVGVSYDF